MEGGPSADFGRYSTIVAAVVRTRNSFIQGGFGKVGGCDYTRVERKVMTVGAGIKKGRNHTLISTYFRLLRSLKDYNSII